MKLKINKNDASPFVMLNERPFAIQEASKRLCANVEHITQDWPTRRIMITSSVPGEGKSVVAINLANDLVASGKNVLLLSCDIWKDSVSAYLQTPQDERIGLADLLMKKCKFADCIHKSRGLYYIGSGNPEGSEKDLLRPEKMRQILNPLAERFDFVICDSPPVSAVADTIVLSTICDGVLFVVRRGVAMKSEVRRSKEALNQVGAKIMGIVFNDVPHEQRGYGQYYGYGYGAYRR